MRISLELGCASGGHRLSHSLPFASGCGMRYLGEMRLRPCAVFMLLGLCGCVPPSAPPQAPTPRSVRVGSIISMPHKVHHVPPVYPTAAIAAKVEGVVIVEAKIDVTGRVTEARILRSIPLLDEAALDAVRQWQFEPVVIDGIGRVPTIAALSVSFKLP